MDPPDNSSFKEVHSTLSMGWNVDRLETAAGARTELANGAWGSDTGGFTQRLTNASLGSNAESTPPKRAGDHEFSDGINGGHKEGFPRL